MKINEKVIIGIIAALLVIAVGLAFEEQVSAVWEWVLGIFAPESGFIEELTDFSDVMTA